MNNLLTKKTSEIYVIDIHRKFLLNYMHFSAVSFFYLNRRLIGCVYSEPSLSKKKSSVEEKDISCAGKMLGLLNVTMRRALS